MTTKEKKVYCEIDKVEIPLSEAVEIWWKYVNVKYEDDAVKCDCCEAIWLNNDYTNVEWWNKMVCKSCLDESYFRCNHCHEYIHNDESIYVENLGSVCNDCVNNSSDFGYCERCENYFHNDDMATSRRCSWCSNDDDDDDVEEKDWKIAWSSNWKWLPTQEFYDCPQWVKDFLYDLYGYTPNIKLSKYRDINLSHEIDFKNKLAERMFIWRQEWKEIRNTNETRTISDTNKYSSLSVKCIDSDWVNVTYEYIDNLWYKKVKTESIYSVHDYYKKIYWKNMLDNEIDKNKFCETKFDLVLSNDIDHKIKLALANWYAFSSCQTEEYINSYAKWIWDWFNNWCNIPISLKVNWNIVGRMLTRLFIDKDNKEYLFMDRLYLNDMYSQQRKELYYKIALRLKEYFRVIVPRYSAHDTSVYWVLSDYLPDENKLKFIDGESSLRQPLRYLWSIYRWYYHDSRSTTHEYDGKIYDYIYYRNFYILE